MSDIIKAQERNAAITENNWRYFAFDDRLTAIKLYLIANKSAKMSEAVDAIRIHTRKSE